MNLEEINRRLSRLHDKEHYPESQYVTFSSKDREERTALLAARDRLAVEHDRRVAERERLELRNTLAATLVPRAPEQIASPFVVTLGQHAIDLAVECRISHEPKYIGANASTERRIVRCEPVLSEPAYAVFLHELGHVVEPKADALQQRHIIDQSGISAPLAECGAWAWAILHTYRSPDDPETPLWTMPMHDRLNKSISTYRHDATPDEIEHINAIVAVSYRAIQPAPDSPRGRARHRERRLEQIAAERQPEPTPALWRAENRLREIDAQDRRRSQERARC